MLDQLNSIKSKSTIVPDDIRKNMLMKKVLVFVQTKKEHPKLTKPKLCEMIGISDSSLKRIMKDLNIKSFYRYEVPINRKKTDLTVNKKNRNKLSSSSRASKGGYIKDSNGEEIRTPLTCFDEDEIKLKELLNKKPITKKSSKPRELKYIRKITSNL